MEYDITPNTKPRMTKSDKWKKRPCVMKYWAFKDEVKRLGIVVPESGSHITFHIPIPKSWNKTKTAEHIGKPHKQVPDNDNMLKALQDAIYEDDAHIWDVRITKLWAIKGKIVITLT